LDRGSFFYALFYTIFTMKRTPLPHTICKQGVKVVTRKVHKAGHEYYRVEFTAGGQRRQKWCSSIQAAKEAADCAIESIVSGDHSALSLHDTDRHAYLRAIEALAGTGVELDAAVRDFVHARNLLGGKTSLAEACRDWVTRHAVELPKISVPDAAQELLRAQAADKKSATRIRQLAGVPTASQGVSGFRWLRKEKRN
jgi:hypothetical protein